MEKNTDNMKNPSEWAERAANVSRACLGDFISSRVEAALERVSRNPEYQELKEYQEKSEEEVDKFLEKLGEGERRTVQRHYERETTIVNYELEETYLQGLKDGINFLLWLDIFQIKDPV